MLAFSRSSVARCCLLTGLAPVALACTSEPLALRFTSVATDDRLELDRVRDAGSEPSEPTPGATEPTDSGVPLLGFSPGPACENFPEDCADPARSKCTLISNSPGYRSSCVPPGGTGDIGDSCERRVRGDDDCAPGGFCSPIGQSFDNANRLVCQELCSTSDACPSGERCLQLLADGPHGVCVPTCTLFDDTACGKDELRCVLAAEAGGSFFGYCEIFGGRAEGEACTLSSQCEMGLSCELASKACRAACDEAHPCPAERRCVPLQLGVPGSLRLCVP